MSANQNVDNFDNLLDLSEYDNMNSFSPAMSPSAASKTLYPATRPAIAVQTPSMASSSQPSMSGPSHQYELYKQQTGIVPGALASTHAVNQANSHISGYNSGFTLDYVNGLSPEHQVFDFNAEPSLNTQVSSGSLDMDMEFDSPPDNQFFFQGTDTINPSAIGGGQESPIMPSQPSSVGRLYPGMHTQAAAMAKAQAQQRQQQQMMQSQQRQQQRPRTKSAQPTDPIVEQKITQLLNSMRAKTASDDGSPVALTNIPRPKKDEDDMDEDERLLASEEGKKLTSKERRQLRNKVSARAFRSRRKEYITQLEAEIANKVTENGELRVTNRALAEENKRLSDLTRMLLSSPSFSNFLDHLSSNPQAAPQQPQQQLPIKAEPQQQQQAQQAPKDANPYGAQPAQQQIGMAMIPEQTMDFSMLNIGTDAFNFQPQVFAVIETPEVPATISSDILSGKASNFVGEPVESDDDKMELPALDMPKSLVPEAPVHVAEQAEDCDEEFDNDPEFALYHSSASRSPACTETEPGNLFGGLEPEKVLARYQLVDASEAEGDALVAMARVQRLSAALDNVHDRLERLCL